MQDSDACQSLGQVDPVKQELENTLQSLQPATAQTTPRDIWYRAGMEAGRRRTSAWRAVAALMTVAAGLSLTWGGRPAAAPVERIVYVRETVPPTQTAVPPAEQAAIPTAVPVARSSADAGYAQVCDAISQHGLDALPRAGTDAGGSPPVPGQRDGLDLDALPPAGWYR